MTNYYSIIGFLDSGGSFTDLLDTPTITARNAITGDVIAGAIIENVTIGVYRISVSHADSDLPVLFIFIPNAIDLAAGITSHILLHDREISATVWDNARKVNR